MEDSVASLDGFLNREGICDIPIGIDMEATDFGGNPSYQNRLTAYCARYKCNGAAEDAVRLYRRLLSGCETSVEIIEIGFLQVISAVLESGPDDVSEKTGLQLFREKVGKVRVMAGK